MKMVDKIYCKSCNEEWTKGAKECPKCGGKAKRIVLEFMERLYPHDQLKGKKRKEGVKKATAEFKVGDDLHVKSGKWYYRKMYIDRENNSYEEIIKDQAGKIIHHCKEPLTEHKGHGNAKYIK